MANTGAHPGVRSLLAKFENNQNNTPSPPSRGRSPVGSDNSGSGRPLSKVRASFVAVDKAAQSPGAVFRNANGSSDGLASPARVRSFNSEDLDGGLKSPVSSSPPSNDGGNAQKTMEEPTNNEAPKDPINESLGQKESAKEDVKLATDNAPSSQEKSTTKQPSNPKTSTPQKAAPASKTVTKRPSTINVTKTNSSTKPASKSPPYSRTTNSAKPGNDQAPKPTRPVRSAAATKEPTKVAAQKPSRTNLVAATKTTPAPRPSRVARDAAKPAPSTASSNTRSARLPTSSTAPNLSGTARGGTTSSLSRKPSSLKPATNGNPSRATTPTASSVRKQGSRSSLPTQPPRERPSSRVSSNGSSKPVDESFLARMMRPTASSASKAHEKVEVKSPPRASKAAPRKVASKVDLRGPRPTKDKKSSENAHTEKPQSIAEEQTNSEEQNTSHPPETPMESSTESVKESSASVVEEPIAEAVEPSTEEPVESVENNEQEPKETAAEPEIPPTETAPIQASEPQVEEPVEQPEASAEQATDAVPSAPQVIESAGAESTEPEHTIETAQEGTAEVNNAESSVELSLETHTADVAEPAVSEPEFKPNDEHVDVEDKTTN